jgi:signal transduction histidine kinase
VADRYEPQLVKPVEETLPPTLEVLLRDEDAIVRHTKSFAILHEVSQRIQREHDPKEMLANVLDLILEVTRATRGYVALLEDGQLRIEVTRTRGPRAQTQAQAISQTVAEHVMERRSCVICTDAAADARFQDAESIFLSDIRSLMAVPILVSDRARGMIEVESSHTQARFTEHDLDLLSVIASTVGVSLDNLEMAQRLVRSEQMAAIGRLATGIAHEVKNHLSPFMLADMIAKRYPGDRQIQDASEMMIEAQQHIFDLVNEIRNFASGTGSSYTMEPTDLAELVERVSRFIKCDATVRTANVVLELEERPMVIADAKGIRQVLINLIKNAADALPERGGRILIHVKTRDRQAILDVTDNGRGIPAEAQARVFDAFFTTKGTKGLGLGLDISKKIVEAHRGQLGFRSTEGKGTTFRMALPLAD